MSNSSIPADKRTLIIHIGAHRTATTSVQDSLFQNKERLKELGYLYPYNTRRHQKLRNQLLADELSVEESSAQMTSEADGCEHDIHTIILSDEDFGYIENGDFFAKFKEYFNVKIFFVLRRQDVWLESWYLQNTKWQWNPKLSHNSFEEFIVKRDMFHWIDYNRKVKDLEKHFEQSDILLSVFEREQMPDGPIAEFYSKIGITNCDDFTLPPHVNQSLSPQIHELMRGLPLARAQPALRVKMIAACERIDREYFKNTGKVNTLLIPYRLRQRIFTEYEAGNVELAQRYFDRERLFFEDYPAADAELANRELPKNPHELLRQLVSPVMLAIVEHRKPK